MLQVLRDFRRVADAIERLAATHSQVVRAQPSDRRLDELEELVVKLELDRARWEVETEGVLLKAEGKLKAANNAEARTRTMKRSYEKLIDPFDPDGEAVQAPVPEGYVPASAEEAMHPVRVDLAPISKKEFALRAKWGA